MLFIDFRWYLKALRYQNNNFTAQIEQIPFLSLQDEQCSSFFTFAKITNGFLIRASSELAHQHQPII